MKKFSVFLLSLTAMAAQVAMSQGTDPLKDAAQRAITANPEVTARFNAFKAAGEEVNVARGAYYPRVDLSADLGKTRDTYQNTVRTPATQTLNNAGVALSATQLLWDGLSTKNDVSRLDHARLTRYFEFLETTEQIALETAKAYIDVARTRQLVRLAEDNYVQHRQVVDQIQSRVKAGVGRGVDLEQAAARLALAESNLTTESANLHDVTERYQRIVGSVPPSALPLPSYLDQGLPSTTGAAFEATVRKSPAIAAAIENLRSAKDQASQRDSAFQPRVEARVRAGTGKNLDGLAGQKNDITAGVHLNWNLFNGGADRARVNQSASLISQAQDLRDKACRDARQTTAIAYNDLRKLNEQIGYLDRNTIATEKARDAYRQQFDIGQRSLLDVLNAENELYTARRALSNAEHDLALAKARTHAGASTLVSALGLSRVGGADAAPDLRYWQPGEDGAARCPLTTNELALTSKADLDARARQQLSQSAGATTAAPVAAPRPAAQVVPKPAPVEAAPAAEPAPATPLSQRLIDWTQAWQGKDVTKYMSMYDPSYKPDNMSRTQWFNNRTRALQKPGPIEVKVENIQRRAISPTMVETQFEQVYTSNNFKDTTKKTLVWKLSNSQWYIVKESNR